MSSVSLYIGNTYRLLHDKHAPWDRRGNYRKNHDWTLYVDVNTDAILERVVFRCGKSFQPSDFVHHSPIPTDNGMWRYCTRQQTYAVDFDVTVAVRGRGGSIAEYTHRIQAWRNETTHQFTEHRQIQPVRMLKLPHRNFGVELELTSDLTAHEIASYVAPGVTVVDSYRQGRETYDEWKLVPDSSIQCSPFLPNCNTFELVSPILNGGEGLSQLHQVLHTLDQADGKIAVNQSMGFHVHVDVSDLNIQQIIQICQNFLKYEAVMDTFFPTSRRSTSPQAQRYFQSHTYMDTTNRRRHDALAQCSTMAELVDLWSPTRYYKLNLQNLVTGRQPTVEFRQHHAVTNYETVAAWVRFCVAMVHNTSKLKPPSPLKPSRTVDEAFSFLFAYCIKDKGLQEFYANRRRLATRECCSSCAGGLGCQR